MKPTYEELEQQLAESHLALRAETTAHENLQVQVEKLASENAGLIKFITQECHVAHIEPETFYEEEITRYVSADGYQPETPTTDAFLAEVRAQVAEEALIIMGNFTSDECGDSVYIAVKEFAENLRKGAQS